MYSLPSRTAGRISRITDQVILARATELSRAILTLNRRDFKKLHFQMTKHAGIIICTEDPDRVGQAQRIAAAVVEVGNLGMKLIRVYRPK